MELVHAAFSIYGCIDFPFLLLRMVVFVFRINFRYLFSAMLLVCDEVPQPLMVFRDAAVSTLRPLLHQWLPAAQHVRAIHDWDLAKKNDGKENSKFLVPELRAARLRGDHAESWRLGRMIAGTFMGPQKRPLTCIRATTSRTRTRT